jgi:hypothetical protein
MAAAQATEWERHGEHLAVALFCKVLAEAEATGAPVTIHRPLKQPGDELGLSVDGLRRRRWLMPDDPSAVSGPVTVTAIRDVASPGRRPSSRNRFRRAGIPFEPATDPSQRTPLYDDH